LKTTENGSKEQPLCHRVNPYTAKPNFDTQPHSILMAAFYYQTHFTLAKRISWLYCGPFPLPPAQFQLLANENPLEYIKCVKKGKGKNSRGD